jgi:hypothetical protein
MPFHLAASYPWFKIRLDLTPAFAFTLRFRATWLDLPLPTTFFHRLLELNDHDRHQDTFYSADTSRCLAARAWGREAAGVGRHYLTRNRGITALDTVCEEVSTILGFGALDKVGC